MFVFPLVPLRACGSVKFLNKVGTNRIYKPLFIYSATTSLPLCVSHFYNFYIFLKQNTNEPRIGCSCTLSFFQVITSPLCSISTHSFCAASSILTGSILLPTPPHSLKLSLSLSIVQDIVSLNTLELWFKMYFLQIYSMGQL